jgi:hypothetical protein
MDRPKKVTEIELNSILEKTEIDKLSQKFSEYFSDGRETKATVLGIDIYKYSKFPIEKQRLIPFTFEMLWKQTLLHLQNQEKYLFAGETTESLKERFVPTGDGGFEILSSPLHALVFAFCFEMALRLFNSGKISSHMLKLVGPLSLRYVISNGEVMQYESNWYGPGIIRNARILAKDKLNRLLIDDETFCWFLEKTDGIESLSVKSYGDFKSALGRSDSPTDSINENFMFNPSGKRFFISQKLESFSTKGDILDVHNVYAQIEHVAINIEDAKEKHVFVTSIGNLNSLGLDPDI